MFRVCDYYFSLLCVSFIVGNVACELFYINDCMYVPQEYETVVFQENIYCM